MNGSAILFPLARSLRSLKLTEISEIVNIFDGFFGRKNQSKQSILTERMVFRIRYLKAQSDECQKEIPFDQNPPPCPVKPIIV